MASMSTMLSMIGGGALAAASRGGKGGGLATSGLAGQLLTGLFGKQRQPGQGGGNISGTPGGVPPPAIPGPTPETTGTSNQVVPIPSLPSISPPLTGTPGRPELGVVGRRRRPGSGIDRLFTGSRGPAPGLKY